MVNLKSTAGNELIIVWMALGIKRMKQDMIVIKSILFVFFIYIRTVVYAKTVPQILHCKYWVLHYWSDRFESEYFAQHPTRHQLYGHLPPITKTIQVRRTRHAGHCWRSRDELIRDVLWWIHNNGRANAGRRSSHVHTAAMWGYRMLSWRTT